MQKRIYDAALKVFSSQSARQVNVREIAQAAGVARGTIYNNIPDAANLFEDVASILLRDMYRLAASLMDRIDDPAVRLSLGMRLFVKRAHEEPNWGRFLVAYGMREENLKEAMHDAPGLDLAAGIEMGRYDVSMSQLPSLPSFIGGATLGAMLNVLDGTRGWREAGTDVVEIVLRGLGLPKEEACKIATMPLFALEWE